MSSAEANSAFHPFLAGGGEMGELTRRYDWSKTSLGSPGQWPLSLRTLVHMMLTSRFPMLIFWGPELITFYNDAFRPSLGDNGKHPSSLGQRGEESWAESWPTIGPMIHNIILGGDAVWFEDQKLPIYRDGQMSYAYWTYSFSSLLDDTETVNGILVTCSETTKAVESVIQLQDTNVELEHLLEQNRLLRQEEQAVQQHLLALFEQSPVAIAIIGKENLSFRMVNSFYAQLVGRQPEELADKPLLEALPELKGQGFDDLIQQVINTGVPFIANEVSVDLLRQNHLETVYVDLVYRPQRETDGSISGVFVVATDVTQQVRSRQAVEASETRIRSIIASAPAGMGLFVGRDLIVELPNQTFIDIVGKGPNIAGKPLREVMPELVTENQPYLQILDDVFTSGQMFQSFGSQVKIVQNGVMTEHYYNITYTPLRDVDGNVFAILDIAIDVTDQILMQQELQENETRFRQLSADLEQQVQIRTSELQASVLDLRRSNENLQQFAYIASHDLQEPLRKIQSFGDLLKMQYAEGLGEGIGFLERMQAAANRMSTLIRDLLTFSRISTQQDTTAPVSLAKVVETVLSDLEIRIRETGARVTVEPLPTVAGDASQLGQLFQNLLSNALKFHQPDTAPAIEIRCQQVAADKLPGKIRPTRAATTYYHIDVSDNGIGFDQKYADRIFQVFQRLHGKNQYAGTGIGLAICEKVAANHGGAIVADSWPNQGTTFSVYLPV